MVIYVIVAFLCTDFWMLSSSPSLSPFCSLFLLSYGLCLLSLSTFLSYYITFLSLRLEPFGLSHPSITTPHLNLFYTRSYEHKSSTTSHEEIFMCITPHHILCSTKSILYVICFSIWILKLCWCSSLLIDLLFFLILNLLAALRLPFFISMNCNINHIIWILLCWHLKNA